MVSGDGIVWHGAGNEGPAWAAKLGTGVGNVGASRPVGGKVGVGNVGGVGELAVVDIGVIVGHNDCCAEGCPKKWSVDPGVKVG